MTEIKIRVTLNLVTKTVEINADNAEECIAASHLFEQKYKEEYEKGRKSVMENIVKFIEKISSNY